MSAIFIFGGNIPDSSDLLNIISSGVIIERCIHLRIILLILSYPLLCLFSNLLINFLISFLSVGDR